MKRTCAPAPRVFILLPFLAFVFLVRTANAIPLLDTSIRLGGGGTTSGEPDPFFGGEVAELSNVPIEELIDFLIATPGVSGGANDGQGSSAIGVSSTRLINLDDELSMSIQLVALLSRASTSTLVTGIANLQFSFTTLEPLEYLVTGRLRSPLDSPALGRTTVRLFDSLATLYEESERANGGEEAFIDGLGSIGTNSGILAPGTYSFLASHTGVRDSADFVGVGQASASLDLILSRPVITKVPEPGTLTLFGLGILGFCLARSKTV